MSPISLEVTLKSELKMSSVATEVFTVRDSRQSRTHRENIGGAREGKKTTVDTLPPKLRSKSSLAMALAPNMKTAEEEELMVGPSMSKSRGRPGRAVMDNSSDTRECSVLMKMYVNV